MLLKTFLFFNQAFLCSQMCYCPLALFGDWERFFLDIFGLDLTLYGELGPVTLIGVSMFCNWSERVQKCLFL